MQQFTTPNRRLGQLTAKAVARLIAAMGDVALIVDRDGVVRDLAVNSEEGAVEGSAGWIGRPLVETVTIESRSKIEALLREAAASEVSRWRQVNHPQRGSADLPISYRAVRVEGKGGDLVLVGRDLRGVAAMQQRLVDAHQSLERDYARLRHVETRYRLLFQMSPPPILICEAATRRVVDVNPAAVRLLAAFNPPLVGRDLLELFDVESALGVQALLAGVQATGRPNDVRGRLQADRREIRVSAAVFRQDRAPMFLVHLSQQPSDKEPSVAPEREELLVKLFEYAPDALVVSDAEGRVVAANATFLDLIQMASPEQVHGESLDRWLGRPGLDLKVLVANLRQHGSVRLFPTTVRGEYGSTADVEIAAVSLARSGPPCLGFLIRNVGRRQSTEARGGHELSRSVDQLTELVGRVPLKDLVRETTDVIERLCIEAALELTNDNRASAAEMLGLSRQSLYVKLRRYGLGDLTAESEERE